MDHDVFFRGDNLKNYFDLGDYSRSVSLIEMAQTWFDRGMVWLFSYNHEEAIVCFERVLKADKNCTLAYWGIAYAIGPNYNKAWDIFPPKEKELALQIAHTALSKAQSINGSSALEKDLIAALKLRYPKSADIENFQPFSDAFAGAMRNIYHKNLNDLDILFIYVEALMNRTPWKLWDFRNGIPNPNSSTLEVLTVLEDIFRKKKAAWEHPGLLHMYIHLMEMSPNPERALKHGDRLTELVPDAGHLVHMATHIDVLCGNYQSVLSRNLLAAKVDDIFKAYAGDENFYTLYRIHNLHFAFYGAMFLGKKEAAISVVSRLEKEVPSKLVKLYPDIFETFFAVAPHVYIRFGMWREILDIEQPDDPELFVTTNTLLYYAKAVALANLDKIERAKEYMVNFFQAYEKVPSSRMLFNNKSRDVLNIAKEMMQGEVSFKAGNKRKGIDHLRKAVELDDNLAYEEPWSWPQPTRHALGALLMEVGEYFEAESVYRADLGLDGKLPRPSHNPRNVWALHGLHECLLHRGDKLELPYVTQLLDQAKARADIQIKSSCFCRSVKT